MHGPGLEVGGGVVHAGALELLSSSTASRW